MSEQTTLAKPTPPKTEKPEETRTNILNASHRCDKCSAAAFVRVNLLKSDALPKGGYLQFCGHHFDRNELALMPYMDGEPINERYKLTYDRHTGTENS